MICIFHKWDGCKCLKCDKARDKQHDWDGCKCKRCGLSGNHVWDLCKGKCRYCEKTCDEQHDWKASGNSTSSLSGGYIDPAMTLTTDVEYICLRCNKTKWESMTENV